MPVNLFKPITEAPKQYTSPIMDQYSVGHMRAVRTGVQELFDTPISINSVFSITSKETLLDDHVLQQRMRTAFDDEYRYDTESDDECAFMRRPPTPIKYATEEGRTGLTETHRCPFCSSTTIENCVQLKCRKIFAIVK